VSVRNGPGEATLPVKRSTDMQVVAYALSRCGASPAPGKPSLPPSWLGVESWKQAYALFFDQLGDGRELIAFSNSLKNARDAFDAHLPSGRVGWVDRSSGGNAFRKDSGVAKIIEHWNEKSDEELRDYVMSIISSSQHKPARLSADIQRKVTEVMIDDAIEAYRAGSDHNFSESRDYDLQLPSGERLPPKAIFGLALEKVIGRAAKPSDFSAGWGQPCFEIIEAAGYPIVPKEEAGDLLPLDVDDERTWAEGSQRRIQHLRRERAPNLANTKKRRFVELHGHLFCERCKTIPSKTLGPLGDACIEVHHNVTAVANMGPDSRTRLSDLQCLCANCHRIVHREAM